VSDLVSEMRFQVLAILKILYLATSKHFHVFNAVFCVGWINIIALRGFLLQKMFLG